MTPSVRKSSFFSLVQKKTIFSVKKQVFFITEEKTGFLEKIPTNLWVLDALGIYIYIHSYKQTYIIDFKCLCVFGIVQGACLLDEEMFGGLCYKKCHGESFAFTTVFYLLGFSPLSSLSHFHSACNFPGALFFQMDRFTATG